MLFQERNQGKGAALRRGFEAATGDVVIVQDADLEYDPREIPRLVQPDPRGRRRRGLRQPLHRATTRRVLYYWHAVGNRVLTTLSNMTTDLNLTDMETCYKVFRREVHPAHHARGGPVRLRAGDHRQGGPRNVARVYEVPISYYGRTYEEGKKIGWKDGFRAVYAIAKYSLKR